MSSIRRFLIIILVATITLFNFVAALQGYRAGLNNTEEVFDQHLVDIAHLLSSAYASKTPVISSENKDEIAFQIWRNPQTLIQRSENSPEVLITALQEGFNYANFKGYRWRSFVFQDKQSDLWIILAERTDIRYTLAEQVILTSILPIVIGVPVVALLIWVIIGSGLRPLSNLAFQLRQKKPQDLSPLENKNIPEELGQLVTSTNDLLRRLSSSFEREKRFSGDAAHELRTPLSIIKIQLFNLRQSMPEQKEALNLISSSVDRMAHLIEQMLMLYRMTPEQFAANFQRVDLHAITQATLIDEYQKIDSKHQKISLEAKSCTMIGDEFALQTLIKNLLDTASKYTPEHGEIQVSIQETPDTLILSVADSGPGIPQKLRERVFERFYRVDGDQHNSMVMGCGLGLSIVKHIVDLHHGKITLKDSIFQTGLLVEVTLPKNQDDFI